MTDLENLGESGPGKSDTSGPGPAVFKELTLVEPKESISEDAAPETRDDKTGILTVICRLALVLIPEDDEVRLIGSIVLFFEGVEEEDKGVPSASCTLA